MRRRRDENLAVIGQNQSAVRRADWSRRRNPPTRASYTRSPSFAEISNHFAIASPIFRKHSRAHIAMKRGMRPVAHTADEAVLDRIDMTILDVACIIGLVADQMLPEPALPDAALIPGGTNGAEPLALRRRPRETTLDQ